MMLSGSVLPVFAAEADISVQASASARSGIMKVIQDLRAKFRSDVKEERNDMKNDIQDRREETKDTIKEKRAELKAEVATRLSKARAQRVKSWFTRTHRRLSNIIDRLTKTADKIEARLNILAASGRNVTQLRSDLAAARVKIMVAKTALASMSAQVDVIITNNTPKEALAKLHVLQKDVMAKIRDAHSALVKVLAATKGLSVQATVSPSVSATPTPTSTPTPTATPTPTP